MALVSPLDIVRGGLWELPREELLISMVTVTNETFMSSIDEHMFAHILVVHARALGDEVFVFHVDMIVHGVKVTLVLFHVIDIYEVAFGTRYPFDLLESSLLPFGESREAVEEAHLKIITLLINDFLNLVIQLIRLDDDVVFKDYSILETLLETPVVEFHMSHKTPDSTHVKVGDVRSLDVRVVVHLYRLFKIIWLHNVLIFPSDLNDSGVWTIDGFDWDFFLVTFIETFLSLRLVFQCEKKALVVVVTRFLFWFHHKHDKYDEKYQDD
jgi:hypothetical protein